MSIKFKSHFVILILLLIALAFIQRGFSRLQQGNQDQMTTGKQEESKSYLPDVLRSFTKEPIPKSIGHIKGILYSENKPSTIISDKNSIVYEKNSIYGVTIVKIHKDKVEFAKNGKTWTQRVGEIPSPEWYR